jgi:DNA-binding response OmpR family regulator
MSKAQDPGETPTVLVVEDDQQLADTYATWLEPAYDVRTTYSGSGGLTWYGPEVDVALVDRRLSDVRGTSVIQNMDQRAIDDQKAILTSIEPGRDLVDLPCDEYLTKPVKKSELRDAVRELQLRSELDDELQRHFTLSSKIAALRNSSATETEAAVTVLEREAKQVRARIDDRLAEIGEVEAAFRAVE